MDGPLFDDELHESLQLAELEVRCVSLGSTTARLMEEHGYELDAETFVVSEIVRAAEERDVDAGEVLGYFEENGFISRTVEAIERGEP